MLAHRQGEWEPNKETILSLATAKPPGLKGDWVFHAIQDERAFLTTQLHTYSGSIFASPWRARIDPETIAATIEWVREGGRALFLGFEMGDRHHNANLAELTHHFGIDPATDIVGPPGYSEQKPYEAVVEYEIAAAEPHPLTRNLTTVRLSNAQTVQVEPGGIEWLRVGRNVVYRPRSSTVLYRDGTLTTPRGAMFDRRENADFFPVAVEAPAGLCGKGRALMIGTWDLLGRTKPFAGDNPILVSRLLDWLAGKDGAQE